MVCLLEGFIQGDYPEPMLIELMRHHLKRFTVEPEKTTAFINSFENKYMRHFTSYRTSEEALRTGEDQRHRDLINELLNDLRPHLPPDDVPGPLADVQDIDEQVAEKIVQCEKRLANLTVNAYRATCKL